MRTIHDLVRRGRKGVRGIQSCSAARLETNPVLTLHRSNASGSLSGISGSRLVSPGMVVAPQATLGFAFVVSWHPTGTPQLPWRFVGRRDRSWAHLKLRRRVPGHRYSAVPGIQSSRVTLPA